MKFHSMGRLLALAFTMVLMPTFASAAEEEKLVIAFRMVKPQTMILKFQAREWIVKHFENESDAGEFVAIGKGLGCEVKQDNHDGHADIHVRCRDIMQLECRSHEEAEARVKWLQAIGFNAKHDH